MRINRLKKKIMGLEKDSGVFKEYKIEYLKCIKQRRRIKSLTINPEYTKIRYVRYADD